MWPKWTERTPLPPFSLRAVLPSNIRARIVRLAPCVGTCSSLSVGHLIKLTNKDFCKNKYDFDLKPSFYTFSLKKCTKCTKYNTMCIYPCDNSVTIKVPERTCKCNLKHFLPALFNKNKYLVPVDTTIHDCHFSSYTM